MRGSDELSKEKANHFILIGNKETAELPLRNPQDSTCLAAKQSQRSSPIFGFL